MGTWHRLEPDCCKGRLQVNFRILLLSFLLKHHGMDRVSDAMIGWLGAHRATSCIQVHPARIWRSFKTFIDFLMPCAFWRIMYQNVQMGSWYAMIVHARRLPGQQIGFNTLKKHLAFSSCMCFMHDPFFLSSVAIHSLLLSMLYSRPGNCCVVSCFCCLSHRSLLCFWWPPRFFTLSRNYLSIVTHQFDSWGLMAFG